jgi:hypothetical protein
MGSSASAGDLRVPWEFVAAGPAHGTIQVAFDAAATEAFTTRWAKRTVESQWLDTATVGERDYADAQSGVLRMTEPNKADS